MARGKGLSRRQVEYIREQRAKRRAGKPSASGVRAADDALHGRVVAAYGRQPVVDDGKGSLYRCVLRRTAGGVICGDRVRWQPTTGGGGVIVAVEPRVSEFARADARGLMRTTAANLDRLFVVVAPEPAPSDDLVDRYLVAAALAGIDAFIVLNKADLGTAACRGLKRHLRLYRDIGYRVLETSARAATGVGPLVRALRHHTGLLVGQSGVGKSSLVKALLPDRAVRIGALSRATGKGTHTTTATVLYPLPTGGELMDSPGVWEYRLAGIEAEALASGFREFAPYLGQCRFADCTHTVEPGCALERAAEEGRIHPHRLGAYRRMRQDLAPR